MARIFALAMLCIVIPAAGQDWRQYDLEKCLTARGVDISGKICNDLRTERDADIASEKRITEQQERRVHEKADEQRRSNEAPRSGGSIHNHAMQQLYDSPEEVRARAYRENLAKEDAKEEAAKKRKCGKDFMAIRVGMTLDRFEDCYEALSYVTETVGKGGAVESYRATFYIVHAQNGRIVSYTRRRF